MDGVKGRRKDGGVEARARHEGEKKEGGDKDKRTRTMCISCGPLKPYVSVRRGGGSRRRRRGLV